VADDSFRRSNSDGCILSLSGGGKVTEGLAPTIPHDNAGHSGLVIACPQHALPFGVIFEEYAARRKKELEDAAREVFSAYLLYDAVPSLRDWLVERDAGFRKAVKAGGSLDTLPSIAAELERFAIEVVSKLLLSQSSDEVKELLVASDNKHRGQVQSNAGSDTCPSVAEQYGQFASDVCGQLLPDPLAKLQQWLADRDAKYRAL
jgi:hypothetical protein